MGPSADKLPGLGDIAHARKQLEEIEFAIESHCCHPFKKQDLAGRQVPCDLTSYEPMQRSLHVLSWPSSSPNQDLQGQGLRKAALREHVHGKLLSPTFGAPSWARFTTIESACSMLSVQVLYMGEPKLKLI